MPEVAIGQDGITQWRRGPVKICYSVYLSSRPTSGGLYIHDSEHPHICTVGAELPKGGGWIYPEGVVTGEQIITSMTSQE